MTEDRKRSHFSSMKDENREGNDSDDLKSNSSGADRARLLAAKFAKIERHDDAYTSASKSASSNDVVEVRKKVYVPRSDEDINFIGLLLGPKGETLRSIEDKSGARVMIRGRGSTKNGTNEDDDDLHVLIVSRHDDSVRQAEDMVRDILFDPAHAASLKKRQLSNLGGRPGATMDDPSIKSLTIPVKKTVAGSIIGRGGEVIRTLKDKSGANITVNDEEDPDKQGCIVHIRGSESCVKKAEDLVRKLVEETEASIADRLSGFASSSNDDRARFKVMVPEDRVGLVIGSRGATIKALQTRYNVKIDVTSPEENRDNPQVRAVHVFAANQAIFTACNDEIQRIIAPPAVGMGGPVGDGPSQNEIYSVPQDKIGLVIGKGGSTIKGIQANTGCKVQVQAHVPGDFMRGVGLEGTDQQRQAAKEEIDGVIAAYAAGTYKTYSQERFGQFQQQAAQYGQQYGQQQQLYYDQAQQYYSAQNAAQWQAYYAQMAQNQTVAPAGSATPVQQQKFTREEWKAWKAYYDQIPGYEDRMPSSPPPHLLVEEGKK